MPNQVLEFQNYMQHLPVINTKSWITHFKGATWITTKPRFIRLSDQYKISKVQTQAQLN